MSYREPRNHKTIDEQIELLKSRNMEIKDYDKARHTLSQISYYTLINGYKDMFLLPKESRFDNDIYDGCSFGELIRLYDFDKNLSNLLFKYIIPIEETFKNVIAMYLSKYFGVLQDEYLNEDNFELHATRHSETSGVSDRSRTLSQLRNYLNSSNNPIKHYRLDYGNVPPWILTKAMTFGNLTYVYRLIKNTRGVNAKQFISAQFMQNRLNNRQQKELFSSAILIVNDYRNYIAHGSRVYCAVKADDKLPIMAGINFPTYNTNHSQERSAVVCENERGIFYD